MMTADRERFENEWKARLENVGARLVDVAGPISRPVRPGTFARWLDDLGDDPDAFDRLDELCEHLDTIIQDRLTQLAGLFCQAAALGVNPCLFEAFDSWADDRSSRPEELVDDDALFQGVREVFHSHIRAVLGVEPLSVRPDMREAMSILFESCDWSASRLGIRMAGASAIQTLALEAQLDPVFFWDWVECAIFYESPRNTAVHDVFVALRGADAWRTLGEGSDVQTRCALKSIALAHARSLDVDLLDGVEAVRRGLYAPNQATLRLITEGRLVEHPCHVWLEMDESAESDDKPGFVILPTRDLPDTVRPNEFVGKESHAKVVFSVTVVEVLPSGPVVFPDTWNFGDPAAVVLEPPW